jgi:hypothetical protein
MRKTALPFNNPEPPQNSIERMNSEGGYILLTGYILCGNARVSFNELEYFALNYFEKISNHTSFTSLYLHNKCTI